MFQVRLKELREKAGLSQSALAKRLGFAQSTIGMWESGKNKPEFDTLTQIADFFHVSVDYLLGREDQKALVPGDEGDFSPRGEKDEVIWRRDGKTVRRKALPGKEELLKQLLDELTEEPDERL